MSLSRTAALPVRLLPVAVLSLAACRPSAAPLAIPPVTVAHPTPATPPEATPATTRSGSSQGYAGHGADSVSPALIAKYAPAPLPTEVSRRIQSMIDVRAPVATRLSPDGRTLYFTWNVTGTPQVWRSDGPNTFPVQLTGGQETSRLVAVTADGKWLVLMRDRNGEENPGLYLLSTAPSASALKQIQHAPKVQTEFQFVTDDGRYVYFRANDKKVDSYAIYRYEIASGKKELVFADAREDGLWSVADHLEDKAGRKLLLEKATGARTAEFWEWDETKKVLAPLFGQGEKEEYAARYSPTAGELLVATPKFGEFNRIYRAKPKGKALEAADVTAITPDIEHDVGNMHLDHARANLYFDTNEAGYTRPHVYDTKTMTERKAPGVATAASKNDHVTWSAPSWDGRYVIVNASAARHPTVSSVYDWQTQKLTQWVTPSAPEVDLASFAVPTLETYPARDGTKIPMFVRRPEKCVKAADPCPVVVSFHGGPEGQSLAGFNPYAQLFVDAGFIFVEPNVRGSDGYGKTWIRADDGPKRLGVITDIEDAGKFVRSAFTVNGKAPKVGVTGGSYGGYSTLIAMTKFAGTYDAGVANVGMSNLLTFLQNTAPYRRALRASEYGDPEKDKDALLQLSPVTYIDKENAPLLLIQGANDPRVPIGEAIQMHDALEKKGATTKLIVFPDEGHGAQKRENKVLQYGHTLDWFEQYLMGKPSSGR